MNEYLVTRPTRRVHIYSWKVRFRLGGSSACTMHKKAVGMKSRVCACVRVCDRRLSRSSFPQRVDRVLRYGRYRTETLLVLVWCILMLDIGAA